VNVVIGGKEYGAGFTLLDMRDLGKSGVMKNLRRLQELEHWEQLDAMAGFVSACVRRGGAKMTADELLAQVKAEEIPALYAAIPRLMGVPEDADPNARSPEATTT
jgi:hypothetical protein